MSSNKEATGNRQERRSDADLPGQYRPIGIGAVAAALSAGKPANDSAPGAANSNERRERESLAA